MRTRLFIILSAALGVLTASVNFTITASAVKKPAKVSKSSVKTVSATSVKVKWKKVKKAKGYQIKISNNKKLKKSKTINVSKNTKTIKKLKSNTKYYIKIRAYAKSGSKKIYGKWNRVMSIKTPKKSVKKTESKVRKTSGGSSNKVQSTDNKLPSTDNQTTNTTHTHKWSPVNTQYPICEYHIIDPYTGADLTEAYQKSDKTTDIYTYLRNNYDNNAKEHKDDIRITEGKQVIVDYKEVVGGYYYNCPICGQSERKSIKINAGTVDTRTDEQKKQKIIELVNQVRAANGKSLLAENNVVMNCAQLKAQDFIDNNYFAHTSPKYGDVSAMLETMFSIDSNFICENIAAGEETPEKAIEGWINSEGHRTNILDDDITQIGIGYVTSDSGVTVNGVTYHDFWVEIFTGDIKSTAEQ